MSTAVISHLENIKPRSQRAVYGRDLYSVLWPLMLLSADVIGLTIAGVVARLCTGNVLANPISGFVMVVALFYLSGLYRVRAVDRASELGTVLRSLVVTELLFACVVAEYSDRPSMLPGLLWLGFAIPVLVTLRSVLRSFLIRCGQGLAPAVIIGRVRARPDFVNCYRSISISACARLGLWTMQMRVSSAVRLFSLVLLTTSLVQVRFRCRRRSPIHRKI